MARAHLAAAESETLPAVMNVGTGRGASVREVIKLVCEAASLNNIIPIETDRRLGDPASLCADVTLINKEIGFVAQHSIEASIKSLF